jgi:O-antigen ligase
MKVKSNFWERFFGLTLNINPIFNLIGIISLPIARRNNFKQIFRDRVNNYLWLGLSLSGLISIAKAYDFVIALESYFIPFAFIYLYVLGRWFINNPYNFLKDMVRGTAFLGLITIIFQILNVNLVISGVDIITKFNGGRGYILGVGDNGLGVLLQAGIVGSLGFLFIEKQRKDIILNIFFFLFSLGGLIISSSRGAMVGSTVGVIFLGVIFSWQIVLLFGGISILSFFVSSNLWNRVKSIISLEHRSNFIRIKIWQGTLNMIKDHFWFGTGPGNFSVIYDKYRLPEDTKHISPHNNYLNIISDWGIIGGILFYGWVFMVMIRSFLRGITDGQKIILAILISFWVHVLFNDLVAVYAGVLMGCLDNDYYLNINLNGCNR